MPSFANAGVVVSITVVAVAGVRVIERWCGVLVDLLGVLSTSFFTSLFGVIVAGDFFIDPVLILFPWSLAGVELE